MQYTTTFLAHLIGWEKKKCNIKYYKIYPASVKPLQFGNIKCLQIVGHVVFRRNLCVFQWSSQILYLSVTQPNSMGAYQKTLLYK
jgi:hypothetical protein